MWIVERAHRAYLSARRMTTIGMEKGIQQERHEYLSRLIYIFLLQIFTDKMTRNRIEAGPQPSAMKTSLRKEREEGKREASRQATLDYPPSPWRRPWICRKYCSPPLWERISTRQVYAYISQWASLAEPMLTLKNRSNVLILSAALLKYNIKCVFVHSVSNNNSLEPFIMTAASNKI